MSVIVLKTIAGMWVADMSGAKDAARIRELFGDVLIPTPFGASVPAAEVQARIARLNPGAEIKVEG